jgi:L-iditol 2-dehydrogenase
MKQIFQTAIHQLELRETAMPVPSEHEVLVHIAYCGICTLEQRLFAGERSLHFPFVPGHEASAIVVQVGSAVKTGVKEGDRVVLDLVNRCHACHACLTGSSNLCENRFNRGQQVLGAFSEYMVVTPQQVLVIPDTLSLKSATLTEPLSCCIRSLKKTGVGLGDTLLISGAGTMGLLHAKAALAMGVQVIVSDVHIQRLDHAAAMGVDYVLEASDEQQCIQTIRDITEGHGVQAVVVTTTSASAVKLAVQVLGVTGTLNIYTSYGNAPQLPVDLNTIHRNEFIITGSEGREQKDFYTAMRALAHQKVVVDDLISRVYPMTQAEQAIEAAQSDQTYRVLLSMEK